MTERYTVDCEDCLGISFDEDGGDCAACDGWGEICHHCGRPAGQCSYYRGGIECQPPEGTRSPACSGYSDEELLSLWVSGQAIPTKDVWGRVRRAQRVNKKASPQAGE